MWRFEKVAHFTSADETDVTFQFLDCTECEADRLLSSFHYVPSTGAWEVREWSKEDGAALVIGSDVQYGDDGCSGMTVSTRSAILQATVWTTLQCGAGSLQPDPEKPSKRVTSDTTVLYTAAGGGLRRRSSAEARRSHLRFRVRSARRSRTVCYAVNLVDSAIGKSAVGIVAAKSLIHSLDHPT